MTTPNGGTNPGTSHQSPARRAIGAAVVVALLLAVGTVLVTFLAAMGSADTSTGETRTITGRLILDGSTINTGVVHEFQTSGEQKRIAIGEFTDVEFQTAMTLRDADDRILGVSNLGMGFAQRTADCRFGWAFINVPDLSFYTLEIGSSGRKVPFSRAQLVATGSTPEIVEIALPL